MQSKEQTRINSFDLLKIIVALIIVFRHYQQTFNITIPKINYIFGGEKFSYLVELFFMISGFLLVYKKNKREKFIDFIVKKIKRLYPMVIISTTSAYLIYLYFYKRTGYFLIENLDINVDVTRYICNCLLIFQNGIFNLNFYGVNNPLWYLSVLLVLFILFYLEKYASEKFNININYFYISTIIIFTIVAFFHLRIPILNTKLARGAIPFFIGCLLNTLINEFNNIYIYILLSILCVFLLYNLFPDLFSTYLQAIYMFVFYPDLLLLCLSSKTITKLTSCRVISELGKISFEVYLWHSFIFYIIKGINDIYKIFPITETWFVLVVACFILLWSSCMYYYVEKPITTKLNNI